jgi:hypothetical protein
MRRRAIARAIFYAFAPFWLYEDAPHYAPMTYFEHLRMNLAYAAVWALRHEDAVDRAFETEVNGRIVERP